MTAKMQNEKPARQNLLNASSGYKKYEYYLISKNAKKTCRFLLQVFFTYKLVGAR